MKAKTIFVIPTYNEKNSLPILIKEIAELGIKDWGVIIVDDNSPDGTGQLADRLAKQYPIFVLHREKKIGFASAYRAGFKQALSYQPEYIMQMDADLSHQPKYIKSILAQLNDYDMVIGSRYVKGGGTANWAAFRKFISRFANLVASILLGSKIKDMTGGMRAFQSKVLERIYNNTSSTGYNFQIEMVNICERLGYKIKEVPIVFVERSHGKSKFDFKIVFESAWRIIFLAIINVCKKK